MEKIKENYNNIRQFLNEARVELRKVAWPTPKQTIASTSVVIIVVMVVSFFLGAVDLGLTKIVRMILG
ncbi:MAG: preprotein translocase subunit SecE [Deltaproteobacteria bacterium]|nr:preprotein translocase subunit SecE [Deltaproteobacteria bacterium]